MKDLFCNLLILLLMGFSILEGQFYFGRNKIQHEHFVWQVLPSGPFHIYYYQGEEELGRLAAGFARQAFQELERKFNHTLEGPIPLVIYSTPVHFQQTNILPQRIPEGVGGFFEFQKGRVVIPFNGSRSDFEHVIRHELVHVFMHAKIRHGARRTSQRDLPVIPLWFTEGLAEWWSRGWDSQAEMVIRDALLYDHLHPLGSLDLARKGFLVYKEGQSFLRYYEEVYGADRLRRVLENFWQYRTFEEALGAVSDRAFEDIATDWKLALKQAAATTLQGEEIPGRMSEQLTRQGTNVSPAVYRDADGQEHTVFLSNRDGYTSIYAHPRGAERSRLVVRGERTADLESLHLLQTDLSVNRQGVLAFVAQSGRGDALQLVDLNTSRTVGRYTHPDLVTIRWPCWSPDGEKIVFSAQDYGGQMDLYLWHPSQRHAVRLTEDIHNDQHPCFSPTGDLVVFSSDRQGLGTRDLFLLRLSSGEVWPLTGDEYRNEKPRWNQADPSEILFLSDRSGTPNVWSLTLTNHADPRPLSRQQVSHLHTGVLDALTLSGDSLLISLFQEYNFQLHQLPLVRDSRQELVPSPDSLTAVPMPAPPGPEASTESSLPYRLKFSFDVAQTAVAYDPLYGFLGGAQLGLSDMLGNRYYHIFVTNTAQVRSDFLSRFNGAVTMVDLTRRANRGLSLFHFANDYYDPYQAFYFERTSGIRGGLNYPLDVFRRLEFSASLWHSQKDFYNGRLVSSLLVSNYISYVQDNTLWVSTGPIDGRRVRITLGPSFDFRRSRWHNYTVLIDIRHYYRPHPALTLAQRSLAWFNEGRDIRPFYIGGSWGLRGYRINELYGSKAILLNQELRFPVARSLTFVQGSSALGLFPIRGALFFDAGNAWEDGFPGFIGSFGLGLRATLMGVIVLRWDLGRRTDFRSLSENWFKQLFFGWDF